MKPLTPAAVDGEACTFLASSPRPKMMPPTLSRPPRRAGGHDLFAILPAIESLDLPDIRLDAGILQLLDRLHHQLRPQLEAVRLLVALERAPSAQRAAAERTGCAASRAGSWCGGCIVARNATSAVTSAGLRFLPYAGMLPPPWRI